MVIHANGVSLFPEVVFLPKVLSSFHSSATIHFLTFYQDPKDDTKQWLQSLDVRRGLLFYLNRTKDYWCSPHLFVTY